MPHDSWAHGMQDATPGGRLVFHVFAVLAQFIRELIARGTDDGLDAARARGARLGRPPTTTLITTPGRVWPLGTRPRVSQQPPDLLRDPRPAPVTPPAAPGLLLCPGAAGNIEAARRRFDV
ncbi:recombinase family protein [Streptomyces sp. NPDC055898]